MKRIIVLLILVVGCDKREAPPATAARPTTNRAIDDVGPFGMSPLDDKLVVGASGRVGYLLVNGHLFFLDGSLVVEVEPHPPGYIRPAPPATHPVNLLPPNDLQPISPARQ